MTKRIAAFLMTWVLCLGLCACGQSASGLSDSKDQTTWQEQYDLGLRYLGEGNYEEAIIAFTAAIEIDPKRAVAYVGRGDAYMLSSKPEENMAAAQADFEKAIELDETLVEAYLGLANIYVLSGDYDKALETLRYGAERIPDERLTIRSQALK